jgi:hypothetical protein
LPEHGKADNRGYMKLVTKILIVFLICFSLLGVTNCGSSSSATSTSSPPVDIPSPVSHLSISSPDATGQVTVTGEAGFADAGTTVTVENTTTSSARLLPSWVIQDAFAQTVSATATVAADGSFSTHLAASEGDTLTVTYTSGGTETSAEDSVPDAQPLISSTVTLYDVSIDEDLGVAIIVGTDDVDGYVFMLDLATLTVTDSLVISDASGLSRVAVDPANDELIAIDTTNAVAYLLQTSDLTLEETVAVLSPGDVTMGPSGGYALIPHIESTVAVSFFDMTTDAPIGTGDATGDDGETHSSSLYVDIVNNGTNEISAMISQLSDDEYHLIVHTIDTTEGTLTQTNAVELTGIVPAGIVLLADGQTVYITDQSGDQVVKVDLTDESQSTIEVGDAPSGITVNEVDQLAYVVNTNDRTVSIIDLTDDSVTLSSVALGLAPGKIDTDRDTSGADVVIVNINDGTVSVITE